LRDIEPKSANWKFEIRVLINQTRQRQGAKNKRWNELKYNILTDLYLTFSSHENILRFDVTMNETHRVNVCQSLQYFTHDECHLAFREAFGVLLGTYVQQTASLAVLHHQAKVVTKVALTDIIYDVWMTEHTASHDFIENDIKKFGFTD
jgi:hypothetical protein